MKNNQLTMVLLGLFLLSTLANGVLVIMYASAFRQMASLQSTALAINMVHNLYNESVEYGKTHPDMMHLLQGGAPAKPATPNAPGAKPQTNK